MSRLASRLLVLVAAFSFLMCSGGSNPSPVGATTPTPTATPAPTPTPWVCPLGPGVGETKTSCAKKSANAFLFDAVYGTIDTVLVQHPDNFVFTDNGAIYVKDRPLYFKHVIDTLNARGDVCAYDDGLEIGVKWTNDYSEQYKIWWTCNTNADKNCMGTIAHDHRIYRVTCTPAWF